MLQVTETGIQKIALTLIKKKRAKRKLSLGYWVNNFILAIIVFLGECVQRREKRVLVLLGADK